VKRSASFKLGTIYGTPTFIHWSLWLFLAGVFVFYVWRGMSIGAAFAGVVFLGTAFGCVLLHELGHALVAKHFGIKAIDITLYPIGGVARLDGYTEDPGEELLIALAGPAVNAFIAALLFGVLTLLGGPVGPNSVMGAETDVLGLLMWMNLSLVAFNLIPAFPMDGGRVLRAWLAMRMKYTSATRIAGWVGQGLAVVFGVLGIMRFHPGLVFIALFVFQGARQEVKAVLERAGG
jgi:Zn-dependent protease